MKKILAIISMSMCALLGHGQGYIILQGTVVAISTNTSSFYNQNQGVYVAGNTTSSDTAPNAYYYALLFDSSMPTGNTGPTNPGWTLVTQQGGAALAMNNYFLAGGLSGTGTSAGVQVNMAAGTTYYVELVGWSASLGTTFSQVESQLGGGYYSGYFGYTSVGTMTPFATQGAGDPTIFPSTFTNGSLTLYSVETIPEPATLALVAIGGASLLLFRRRKII
jgi:hypothetical protein